MDKKDDKKKDKKPKNKWPKLKGKMSFKAKAKKCLPLFVVPGKLTRIDDKKAVEIDVDSLEYSAKNILCKAVQIEDVEVCKDKGGK